MKNQIRFFGENWYVNVGGARLTLRFCGVHNLASRQTFLWTLCYRKGSEWDLLEHHRTIILLPNGERFVYEAEVRVETEVTQGFNYSVICNEIAHIPSSEWLEEVSSAYHDTIRQDALRRVELRVGSYQFALPFEALRSAAVVIAKAQALN